MSKKDMDNYIKDVQEGGIIDPGHLRENEYTGIFRKSA